MGTLSPLAPRRSCHGQRYETPFHHPTQPRKLGKESCLSPCNYTPLHSDPCAVFYNFKMMRFKETASYYWTQLLNMFYSLPHIVRLQDRRKLDMRDDAWQTEGIVESILSLTFTWLPSNWFLKWPEKLLRKKKCVFGKWVIVPIWYIVPFIFIINAKSDLYAKLLIVFSLYFGKCSNFKDEKATFKWEK